MGCLSKNYAPLHIFEEACNQRQPTQHKANRGDGGVAVGVKQCRGDQHSK